MSNCSVADVIIYGGTIYSMDPECEHPEAVAIAGSKIIGVGEKKKLLDTFVGHATKLRKLEDGEALLPGFIEPHSHCIQLALCECSYISCSAYTYESWDEISELFNKTIADIQQNNPGGWAVFIGWDPELMPSLPRLDFDFLDGITQDIPLVVIGQSGHVAWANRKAFKEGGVPDDVPNPPGGTFVRDDQNNLTGQMFEPPTLGILLAKSPQPTLDDIAKAVNDTWMAYSANGFTTITDLGYIPNVNIDKVVETRAAQEDCPVRVALYEMVPSTLEEDSTIQHTCCRVVHMDTEDEANFQETDKMWIAGIKIVGDGSPHSGTSAVAEPYMVTDMTYLLGFPSEKSPCGILNYPTDEDLFKLVEYYHGQGKQIAVHAHGERTIEQALRAFEKAQNANPNTCAHRIEHLGLITEEHIEKAAKLGVSLSFFVEHLFFYATTYATSIFGPERTSRWAPVSLALKHNALWTIHQDHPTFPGIPTPFDNLMTAVTRSERYKPGIVYGPQYRIPMAEALKGYTINAAKQIGQEQNLGSLTVGKQADLVIVDADPVRVANADPYNIDKIKVVGTYMKGREFTPS